MVLAVMPFREPLQLVAKIVREFGSEGLMRFHSEGISMTLALKDHSASAVPNIFLPSLLFELRCEQDTTVRINLDLVLQALDLMPGDRHVELSLEGSECIFKPKAGDPRSEAATPEARIKVHTDTFPMNPVPMDPRQYEARVWMSSKLLSETCSKIASGQPSTVKLEASWLGTVFSWSAPRSEASFKIRYPLGDAVNVGIMPDLGNDANIEISVDAKSLAAVGRAAGLPGMADDLSVWLKRGSPLYFEFGKPEANERFTFCPDKRYARIFIVPCE